MVDLSVYILSGTL